MRDLIKTDIRRFILTKWFLIAVALTLLQAMDSAQNNFISLSGLSPEPLTYVLDVGFRMNVRAVVILAIYAAFTAGYDRFSGIVRNRLITGYSKTQIYFSKLTVTLIEAAVICTCELIFCFCYGWESFFRAIPVGKTVRVFLLTYFGYALFAVFSTMIGMLCERMVVAVIVSGVLCYGLISFCEPQTHILSQPKEYVFDGPEYKDVTDPETGRVTTVEVERTGPPTVEANSEYVDEPLQSAIRFTYWINPARAFTSAQYNSISVMLIDPSEDSVKDVTEEAIEAEGGWKTLKDEFEKKEMDNTPFTVLILLAVSAAVTAYGITFFNKREIN